MIARLVIVLIASVGPLAFPAAQSGYGSLHDLALTAVLPSVVGLGTMWFFAQRTHPDLALTISRGAFAGALATLALEVVRYSGFRLGFMPGNLPQLMGVLLLDRFALGPSPWSDVAGFAYHFWNGAAFGIMFTAVAPKTSLLWPVVYGLAIGVGFLVSPVVQSLGVGLFGRDFGWQFAATVLIAHAAFGMVLGKLLQRSQYQALVLRPLEVSPGSSICACSRRQLEVDR
ncbi:MAG TPA: hypothetical protein VNR64_02465 [Vicinamibacterales bacterium]|nr:hypothetical protein [Vicinamibacterales bacterium]